MSVANHLLSLLTYVSGISAFSTSTGTSQGEQLPDPTGLYANLPSTWVIYAGRAPISPAINGVVAKGTAIKNQFVIMVYLDNSQGQDNLMAVQIPLLESIVSAVAGNPSLDTPDGYRFSFEGERLTSVNPKRLIYEMRFSIVSHV